ncbi:MAG: hypothetical protein AAF363_14950 [Bacteroidota bacterium]
MINYSFSIVSTLFSVVALYAISDKVEIEKEGALKWLSDRVVFSRALSVLSFLIACFLVCTKLGVANGILASSVLWMIGASLMLLFAPFKTISGIHLVALSVGAIFFELIVNLL